MYRTGRIDGNFKENCADVNGNVGEEQINWNEIIMFGINVTCKNKKVIHVILALAKYSIWNRRNIVKQKSKVNLWMLFKRKLEEYLQILCSYLEMEDKVNGFDSLMTSEVRHILSTVKVKLPM